MKPTPEKQLALTPSFVRRILPALRMMVRYPSRPAKVVSTETSVELADIYAFTETHGRPTAATLAQLERELEDGTIDGESGLTHEKLRDHFGQIGRELEGGTPASAAVASPRAVAAPKANAPKYLAVSTSLCADPMLSEGKACRQHNLDQGTWCQFKMRTFDGESKLNREKICAHFGLPPVPARAPARETPWLFSRRFRVESFRRWRPLLEMMASNPRLSISEACEGVGENSGAAWQYVRDQFGSARDLSPEKIEAFLAFGESNIASVRRAAPVVAAVAAVEPAPPLSHAPAEVATPEKGTARTIALSVPGGAGFTIRLTLELLPEAVA